MTYMLRKLVNKTLREKSAKIVSLITAVAFTTLVGSGVGVGGVVGVGGGCTSEPSDKALMMIRTNDARELVSGKKRLLVLGTKTGTWVDARTEADYRAGHIPGAINLPFERVTREHKALDQYEILIVYGNDYNDPRNGMSKRLMELGHSDVRTLVGGMRAWKNEGHPVETSP